MSQGSRIRRFGRTIAGHPLWVAVGAIASVAAVVVSLVLVPAAQPTTSAGEVRKLEIYPVDEPLGRCLTLHGAAPDSDKDVWLATRAVGGEFYFTRARREPDPTRWRATTTIGSGRGGVQFEFFAFELDRPFSDFLASIEGVGENGTRGYFFAKDSPPGVDLGEPDLTAISAADPATCT